MGSDGSPYEKRVDAKGRVLSDECIADEVPFTELPEGWAWARLGSIVRDTEAGKSPRCENRCRENNEWGVIKTTAIQEGHFLASENKVLPSSFTPNKTMTVRNGDLLITRAGPKNRTGVLCVVGDEPKNLILSDKTVRLCYLTGYLDPVFLMLSLNSPLGQRQVTNSASGMAASQVNISQEKMKEYLIPIPPLTEQSRIVKRVGDLMPLVEEYGKLEDAREALDAALPDRLRKSVLQMAVQGKLVPQDPADEPASVLLERIREQRRQLVAEKKMKAPKGGESVIFRGSDGRRYEKRMDAKGRESEPICIEDEIPFEIPDSWEWVRLSTVLRLSSGLGYKKDNLSVKGEHMVRVLRGGNIGEDDEPLIKDNDVLISAEFVDDSLLLRDGQIITPAVTSLENVGKAAIVRNADGETVCGGFVFYLTPYLKSICHSEYLHRYLASPGHIAFCKSVVKKSGQAFYNLSKASLNSALIAIPPLAEQHRIVERVNELMPLITNQ